jgi:hypothetical protein
MKEIREEKNEASETLFRHFISEVHSHANASNRHTHAYNAGAGTKRAVKKNWKGVSNVGWKSSKRARERTSGEPNPGEGVEAINILRRP